MHELAAELSWTSRQLIAALCRRGEYVKSAASALPRPGFHANLALGHVPAEHKHHGQRNTLYKNNIGGSSRRCFDCRRPDSARRGHARPSVRARVTARLRAARFDRRLAVGVPAPAGSALAAHAARRTSVAERSPEHCAA
jgi:hypothetical protein